MKFLEMIEALKEGKTTTRYIWQPESGYLVFMPGMSAVWKITTQPTVNAGNNLFSVEDFCADDWQVSNGANKPIEQEVEV